MQNTFSRSGVSSLLLLSLVACSSEALDSDRLVDDWVDLDGDGVPDDPSVIEGSGGASGTGAATGTGASGGGVAEPPEQKCVGGFLIEDFEGSEAASFLRPYNDGSPGASMTPAAGSVANPEMSADGGSLALHLQGSGYTNWGAGIGRKFDVPVECEARSLGIRFRAKGSGPITVAAPVTAIVPVDEGGSCTATDACNNGHETTVQLTNTWATYEVLWTDLEQLPGWGIAATFDARSVLELLFASRPEAQPFDFWIDDLQLIDNGAVVEPVEPEPGTGGGSATGGAPATGGASATGGNQATGGTGGGGSSNCVLDKYMSKSIFENTWFSTRRNSFYKYEELCTALEDFPGFANSGNAEHDKREIAAFFGNVARETGELQYIEEIDKGATGAAPYYGRGPIQLTWIYNYRAAGEFLGVDLVNDPDRIVRDGVVAWKTALWFWMHSDGAAKGTCHNAIVGGLGFGQTINIINGGIECGAGRSTHAANAVAERIAYYQNYCGTMNVAPGNNLDCL